MSTCSITSGTLVSQPHAQAPPQPGLVPPLFLAPPAAAAVLRASHLLTLPPPPPSPPAAPPAPPPAPPPPPAAGVAQHHLLRHVLSAQQCHEALRHFATTDSKAAARQVNRMSQRELRDMFAKVGAVRNPKP